MQITDSNMLWSMRNIIEVFDEYSRTITRKYQPTKTFFTKNFSSTKMETTLVITLDGEDILQVDTSDGYYKSDLLNDEDTEKLLGIFIDEAEAQIDEESGNRIAAKKVKKEKVKKKVDQLIKQHKK